MLSLGTAGAVAAMIAGSSGPVVWGVAIVGFGLIGGVLRRARVGEPRTGA